MNKFEILAWGLLISFFTAALSGAVVGEKRGGGS